MVITLVQRLPASVLEIIAVTLFVVAIGLMIILFAALMSETVCRRIIRLVNTFAKLTNKDIRAVRHKRGK
jgi:ABC-type dipeptide/oligopeptide/nickel transport system permease component